MRSSSLRRFKIDGINYTFSIDAFNRFFQERAKGSFHTITQYEEIIAGVLNVDRSTIHNWRMELNGPSDIDKVQALADYWHITIYDLLDEEVSVLEKLLSSFGGDSSDEITLPVRTVSDDAPVVRLQIPDIKERQTATLPGICYISPTIRDDFKPVARSLKEQKPVIVNFSDTERKAAVRAYNCMLGAAYALDSSVQSITPTVLLFSPKETEVSELSTGSKGKDLFRTLV